MNNLQYLRNDVLSSADGTLVRLLALDVDTDSAWLIKTNGAHALPFECTASQIGEAYVKPEDVTSKSTAEYRKSDTRFTPLARPPTAASLALSVKAWKRIAPLVNNPGIFAPRSRARLLRERAQDAGDNGTEKTLLKHLRAYWQGGQTVDALLGHYNRCGRPEMEGTGGRGRKAKGGGTLQMTAKDLEAMKDVVETYYFAVRHRTLKAALLELHKRHYTYRDGNGVSCLLPLTECPSYRQFSHFLKTKYPREARIRSRDGNKVFEQNHRSRTGSVQLDCHGVGHMYEFDATIADVLLASTKDAAAIVGKPTLYLLIDRASRLIVGWYVGFENASYSAAMQAIRSIGEDKEALCRRLGITYDADDWPAHGVLPELFLLDQGELVSKVARQVARSMRCTITNVPGLRPDWKPLVECGFSLIHQIISSDTPAYVPDADNKARRKTDYAQDAALNLHEFTSIIVKAIITHNQTMQVGYPLTVAQVADGVRPIPRELWAQGIARRMGILDRMDAAKVEAELLPQGKATISGNGIYFERCYYSCPEALKRGWLVEGRLKRCSVEVAFDYRLVDEIIVFAPDGSGSVVATLTKDSVMFAGTSFADVKRHFVAAGVLTSGAMEVKRQARFEYSNHADRIIKVAAARRDVATKGKSRSSRKKDTAPARQEELYLERDALAVLPAARPAEVTPIATTALPSATVIPLRSRSTPAADAARKVAESEIIAMPSAEVPAPAVPLTGLQSRMSEFRKGLLG